MAQLADITTPFSYLLNKGNQFIWIKKCQKVVEDINIYLLNPSILHPVDHTKPLYLYISATTNTIGTMLV